VTTKIDEAFRAYNGDGSDEEHDAASGRMTAEYVIRLERNAFEAGYLSALADVRAGMLDEEGRVCVPGWILERLDALGKETG